MNQNNLNNDVQLQAGQEEDFIKQIQQNLEEKKNDQSPETEEEEKNSPQQPENKKKHSLLLHSFLKVFNFTLIPLLLLSFYTYLILRNSNRFILILLILSTALIFGLYYYFILTRNIKKMTQISESILKEIAEGNLSINIDENKELKEKLGILADPINNVIKEISAMVTKIELSIMDIVGNSDALAYFAESMATKTDQEEESVIKIERLASLLNRSMQTINNNVKSVYQNSKNSITEAETSSHEVLSLIEEMNSISVMSDKIVDTMNFINDMADETNLLALNAAIQAAHAGEEGKGFGVVATEIRELSESSTEATKTIFHIINKTIESIERGVRASEKAKKALNKIVFSIQSTEDLVGKITHSISTQSETTNSLKKSVNNIQDLTKNINQDMQNMKSAISNLSGQAQILKNLIKGFDTHASSINSEAIFGVE